MKWIVPPVVLGSALALGGCATDRAIFVTNTSLGLNLDTAPATVSIAYDRTEGVLAPSYETGGIGPILGTMETDGAIIAPKVRQLYGTGDAALIAARNTGGGIGAPIPAPTPKKLAGEHHTAFVGTSTTLGVKAAFSAETVLSSFNLGFKRKEFSSIRMISNKDGEVFYPSVLAALDMTIQAPTASTTMLTNRQFISTGAAADVMAASEAGRALKAATVVAAKEASAKGAALAKTVLDKEAADQKAVSDYVTQGGGWDTGRLATLVDKVGGLRSEDAAVLKGAGTFDALKALIDTDTSLWSALAAATH